MRRIHAMELEDQPWFPSVLRDAGVAILRLAAERTGQAAAIRPVIERALDNSGEHQILDLCSGGGGPIVAIAEELGRAGREVHVTMTDRFPSESALARLRAEAGWIEYEPESIDATAVPAERPGLRTICNAFHHFRPAMATRILGGAIAAGRPIVVVEVLQRRWLALLGMMLLPFATLVSVPWLRPFRWSWLVLTYVVPLIPLFVMWDGTISTLRVYTRDELLALAAAADPERTFEWTVEEIAMRPSPVPGLALIGIPKQAARSIGA